MRSEPQRLRARRMVTPDGERAGVVVIRDGIITEVLTGDGAGSDGGPGYVEVPDECVLTINHRFAPDRTADQAVHHLRVLFEGYDLKVVDSAEGALPGLSAPTARELVEAAGGKPVAKLGWTDVARFAALGIPAVNFGPGDPTLAHTQAEHVPAAQITECATILRAFVSRFTQS